MTFASIQEVVTHFVNGSAETGSHGVLSIGGSILYTSGKEFAKRTSSGEFILSSSQSISDEVNDALLGTIVTNSKKFRRVKDFSCYTSENRIFNAIESSDIDFIRDAADFLEIAIDNEKFGGITSLRDKKNAAQEEYNKLSADLNKAFEDFGKPFKEAFDNIRLEKIKAEEAAQSENAKVANAKWDANETLTNDEREAILGSGGGQRLRIIQRTGAQARLDVQGSSEMYRTSLNSFRSVFNMVAPYIWGEKNQEMQDYTKNNRYNHFTVGNTRTHNVTIDNDYDKGEIKYLHLGCQKIKVAELERFASLQGWPLDGTTVGV